MRESDMQRCQRQYETPSEDSELDNLYVELELVKKEMQSLVNCIKPNDRYLPNKFENEISFLVERWNEICTEINALEEE